MNKKTNIKLRTILKLRTIIPLIFIFLILTVSFFKPEFFNINNPNNKYHLWNEIRNNQKILLDLIILPLTYIPQSALNKLKEINNKLMIFKHQGTFSESLSISDSVFITVKRADGTIEKIQ